MVKPIGPTDVLEALKIEYDALKYCPDCTQRMYSLRDSELVVLGWICPCGYKEVTAAGKNAFPEKIMNKLARRIEL